MYVQYYYTLFPPCTDLTISLAFDARTRMEKGMLENMKGGFPCANQTVSCIVYIVCPETPLPEHKTSDDGKGNPTLPEEKSEGVSKAVENVENNTRLSQSHTNGILYSSMYTMRNVCLCPVCIDPAFSSQYLVYGQEIPTTGGQQCRELFFPAVYIPHYRQGCSHSIETSSG